ncbi:MAG: transposase family protein [Nitrospirota bacterium]
MKYLNFNHLSKKPTKFYRFTGLEVGEFLVLKEEIEPLWQKAEIKRLSRPNRQRAIGGGRKYHLRTLEDKMLLVFLFYRLYLNYDFLGFIFGFDGTNAGRLIKRMEPVLTKRFKLPSIKRLSSKRISTLEEFREAYPDLYEVIVGDATEQEIPRPKNKRKNKEYRSGKKKRHTLKTQIFIERKTGKILEVSPPFPGSWHDYKIFKKTKIGEKLPRDKPCHLDKAYQGAKKDYPDLKLFIPEKANRWHKLTQAERESNKILNKIRVKIEHSILKCKRFKILKQIYRHPLKDYHQRFQIIAGLINFQLRNKENLIPVSIPTFTKKEIVFSKV